MRAKKRQQIIQERKERLIHKETTRFIRMLKIHSLNDSNLPEKEHNALYENVSNHLREFIDKSNANDDEIRSYIDDEQNKLKQQINDNISLLNEEAKSDRNIEENIDTKEIKFTSLKDLKNAQFSNLATKEIKDAIIIKNEDEEIINFKPLSREDFFHKIIKNKKQKKLRFLRYVYLKFLRLIRKLKKSSYEDKSFDRNTESSS